MATLPASLDESARQFPYPERDQVRTERRKWILTQVPKGGIGAEIGVFRGHFSEALLDALKPRKAYFIDPWTLSGEFFDPAVEATGGKRLPTALAKQEAQWRTQRFKEVDRRFVEASFPACSDQIEEKLDWLYLDAGHGYEETLARLKAADEMLAPRGILFGDGWTADPAAPQHGVFQAVNMFVKNSKFDVVAAGPYGQWALRRRGPWKLKTDDATADKPAATTEKAAAKAGAKGAAKSAVNGVEKKAGNKPGNKAGNKAGGKVDDESGQQAGDQSAKKANKQPGNKPGNKANKKAGKGGATPSADTDD